MSNARPSVDVTRYLSSGATRVPGLVRPGAFRFILALDRAQKEAGICGHVGEIGVLFGKLFILLYLLRREDERAVAVDDFSEVASREQFQRHLIAQAAAALRGFEKPLGGRPDGRRRRLVPPLQRRWGPHGRGGGARPLHRARRALPGRGDRPRRLLR